MHGIKHPTCAIRHPSSAQICMDWFGKLLNLPECFLSSGGGTVLFWRCFRCCAAARLAGTLLSLWPQVAVPWCHTATSAATSSGRQPCSCLTLMLTLTPPPSSPLSPAHPTCRV